MQLGFNLSNSGKLCDPGIMSRVAKAGEALGYDYLTVTDHVVLPDLKVPGFPYSESGEFYGADHDTRHEQLTTTAWIAAQTSKIRLVLAVIVVPHRQAVLAAKQLATIDVLSGGRLVVGVGAGWLKAEFDAVVTTPFAERGAVTDEYLQVFKTLWTNETSNFAGKYVNYQNIAFRPAPIQKPHPPIWVGGESPPSIRRTARYGDAWYPIGTNAKHPLDSLELLAAGMEKLRKMTEDAGRDPNAVTTVLRFKRFGDEVGAKATDGNKRLMHGTPAQMAADIRALRDLGVTAFDIDIEKPTEADSLARLTRFKEDVWPLV
jgi:probable F420-dependent oxidoreductase